jgi:type IV secretory pathway TrbL component
MKQLFVVGMLSLFAVSPALAQEGAACAAKAVGKDGKALAGAAKTSSMKKCCEASAVGKDGKKLAGAAKASFMKKCETGS